MYRATLTKNTNVTEFFDHVKKACLAGSFPSMEGRYCKYRANGQADCDKACLVGIFIPNEKYEPRIDTEVSIRTIINGLDAPDWLLKEYNSRSLFMILQSCHDDYALSCQSFDLKWDNRIFLTNIGSALTILSELPGVNLDEIQDLFPNG